MLPAESEWIASQLAGYPAHLLSPLLNVGSGTEDFRREVQPWTERNIFEPLRHRGVEVVHLDIRGGDGIDIHADLLNDLDIEKIGPQRYRALLCCNVLEHVPDPGKFAERCAELVAPGGLLIVTVPRGYPQHDDPVDTQFQPTPAQAAALFPETTLLSATVIDSGASYLDELVARPRQLLRDLVRLSLPFLNWRQWRSSVAKLSWLFHNYRVSGIVLHRNTPAYRPRC